MSSVRRCAGSRFMLAFVGSMLVGCGAAAGDSASPGPGGVGEPGLQEKAEGKKGRAAGREIGVSPNGGGGATAGASGGGPRFDSGIPTLSTNDGKLVASGVSVGATGAASADTPCPPPRERVADAGCCWPGQSWSRACTGTPTCPSEHYVASTSADGRQSCVLTASGRSVLVDRCADGEDPSGCQELEAALLEASAERYRATRADPAPTTYDSVAVQAWTRRQKERAAALNEAAALLVDLDRHAAAVSTLFLAGQSLEVLAEGISGVQPEDLGPEAAAAYRDAMDEMVAQLVDRARSQYELADELIVAHDLSGPAVEATRERLTALPE